MKKTDGPFGKSGFDEKKLSVGTAPKISAEGEAIVDDDDESWVVLTEWWKREEAKPRARQSFGNQSASPGRNRTTVSSGTNITVHEPIRVSA